MPPSPRRTPDPARVRCACKRYKIRRATDDPKNAAMVCEWCDRVDLMP